MDFHDSGQASPGVAASEADADFDPLIAALTRPIAALETRYRATGRAVTEIIEDLSLLTARTRGQHPSSALPTAPVEEPIEERPPLGRLQVRYDSDAILFDFHAAVAGLPGVRSVTTLGGHGNQVTLLVELGSSPGATASAAGPATGAEFDGVAGCTVRERTL